MLERQDALLTQLSSVPPALELEAVTERGRALYLLDRARDCLATMAPAEAGLSRIASQMPLQKAHFLSQYGRCRRVVGERQAAHSCTSVRGIAAYGNDQVGIDQPVRPGGLKDLPQRPGCRHAGRWPTAQECGARNALGRPSRPRGRCCGPRRYCSPQYRAEALAIARRQRRPDRSPWAYAGNGRATGRPRETMQGRTADRSLLNDPEAVSCAPRERAEGNTRGVIDATRMRRSAPIRRAVAYWRGPDGSLNLDKGLFVDADPARGRARGEALKLCMIRALRAAPIWRQPRLTRTDRMTGKCCEPGPVSRSHRLFRPCGEAETGGVRPENHNTLARNSHCPSPRYARPRRRRLETTGCPGAPSRHRKRDPQAALAGAGLRRRSALPRRPARARQARTGCAGRGTTGGPSRWRRDHPRSDGDPRGLRLSGHDGTTTL